MQSLEKLFLLVVVASFSLPSSAQYSVFGEQGENQYQQGDSANAKESDPDEALDEATPVDADDAFLDDDANFEEIDAQQIDAPIENANINANVQSNNIEEINANTVNATPTNDAAVSSGANATNNLNNGSNNLYNNQSQQQNSLNQAPVQPADDVQQSQQSNVQTPDKITNFSPQEVETQNNSLQSTPANSGNVSQPVQTQNAPEETVLEESETGFETRDAPVEMTPANAMPVATDTPAPPMPTLPQPNEFSGAPPLPGTRRDMADGEAPIEYIVQPGDTLFDICDQLLDEPYYWPKLWSFNPQIKNPHFIYPGMVLKFYTGDANQPPYMEVVQSDEELPVDRDGLNPAELVANQDVPSVEDPVEQVAGDDLNQPNVMADEWDLGGTEGWFLESGTVYSDPVIQLTIPAFIFSEQKETLGEVVGGGEGHTLSGAEDNVIIRSEVGLTAGTTYTVIRKGDQVKEFGTDEDVGYFYDFVGNLKVSKKLNTEALYLSKAERPLLVKGIRSGDLLIPFVSTRRQIPSKDDYGRVVSLEGATVLSFDQPGSTIGGRGNFVFINRGSGQLAEGDAVKLYSAYGHSATKDLVDQYPKVEDDFEYIGIARIVNVSDAAALGFIMESSREIRLGDPAGR